MPVLCNLHCLAVGFMQCRQRHGKKLSSIWIRSQARLGPRRGLELWLKLCPSPHAAGFFTYSLAWKARHTPLGVMRCHPLCWGSEVTGAFYASPSRWLHSRNQYVSLVLTQVGRTDLCPSPVHGL